MRKMTVQLSDDYDVQIRRHHVFGWLLVKAAISDVVIPDMEMAELLGISMHTLERDKIVVRKMYAKMFNKKEAQMPEESEAEQHKKDESLLTKIKRHTELENETREIYRQIEREINHMLTDIGYELDTPTLCVNYLKIDADREFMDIIITAQNPTMSEYMEPLAMRISKRIPWIRLFIDNGKNAHVVKNGKLW